MIKFPGSDNFKISGINLDLGGDLNPFDDPGFGSVSSGQLQGFLSGAMSGALASPGNPVIGAVIGGAIGSYAATKAEDEQKEALDKAKEARRKEIQRSARFEAMARQQSERLRASSADFGPQQVKGNQVSALPAGSTPTSAAGSMGQAVSSAGTF